MFSLKWDIYIIPLQPRLRELLTREGKHCESQRCWITSKKQYLRQTISHGDEDSISKSCASSRQTKIPEYRGKGGHEDILAFDGCWYRNGRFSLKMSSWLDGPHSGTEPTAMNSCTKQTGLIWKRRRNLKVSVSGEVRVWKVDVGEGGGGWYIWPKHVIWDSQRSLVSITKICCMKLSKN